MSTPISASAPTNRFLSVLCASVVQPPSFPVPAPTPLLTLRHRRRHLPTPKGRPARLAPMISDPARGVIRRTPPTPAFRAVDRNPMHDIIRRHPLPFSRQFALIRGFSVSSVQIYRLNPFRRSRTLRAPGRPAIGFGAGLTRAFGPSPCCCNSRTPHISPAAQQYAIASR